jgi:hypothetical protein
MLSVTIAAHVLRLRCLSGDVYTGQWCQHKKHGKGKFQWISGACVGVILICLMIALLACLLHLASPRFNIT